MPPIQLDASATYLDCADAIPSEEDCAPDPAHPQLAAAGLQKVSGLVADERAIYVSDAAGIWFFPKCGGAGHLLLANASVTDDGLALTPSGTLVWMSEARWLGVLPRGAKSHRMISFLASGELHGITTDDQDAYVAVSIDIMRVALDGSDVSRVLRLEDSDAVYTRVNELSWIDSDSLAVVLYASNSGSGSIASLALGDGTLTKLSTGQSQQRGIASTSDTVIWGARSGVYSVPASGGEVTKLQELPMSTVLDVAIGPDAAYWVSATYDASSNYTASIYRLANGASTPTELYREDQPHAKGERARLAVQTDAVVAAFSDFDKPNGSVVRVAK
jgi:hypothetical protein